MNSFTCLRWVLPIILCWEVATEKKKGNKNVKYKFHKNPKPNYFITNLRKME
jgi:hypothetical protein